MVPGNWDGTSWFAASQVITPSGGTIYGHIWPATARTSVNAKPAFSKAQRDKKSVFIKGISETVHIETATNVPWQWRRIVISCKGLSHHVATDDNVAFNGTNGYMRTVRGFAGQQSYEAELNKIVFQGEKGLDWLTEMVAPINTAAVTLHSDKTRTMRSGNAVGTMQTFKMWTPINKLLVYADKESGGDLIPSRWSVDDKPGMGDIYILDYFRASLSAGAGDILDWRPNATLYWHER